MADGRYFKTA